MKLFEAKVKAKLEADGWWLLQNGWPDFLCIRVNAAGKAEIKGVEVKSRNDMLRPNQALMLTVLQTQFPIETLHEGAGFGSNAGDDMHTRGVWYLLSGDWNWRKPKRFAAQIFAAVIERLKSA